MSLILWIFALSVLLVLLRGVTGPCPRRPIVKMLFFPGVVLAIAARSVAAWIARAEVKAVNPPWRAGEPVELDKSKLPILGPLLLSLISFAGCLIFVGLARAQLVPALQSQLVLPVVHAEPSAVSTVLDTCFHALEGGGHLGPQALAAGWRLWIFVYLAAAILLYFAPSYDEWKQLAGSLVALVLALSVVDYFGITAGFLSRGWFARRMYGPAILEMLALLFTLAWFELLACAGTRAGLALLRAVFSPSKGKGEGS